MDFTKLNVEIGALRFDGESPEANIIKAEKLSKLKVEVQQKYWDSEMEGDKIDKELLMSDRVQEGKNKDQREAIMEIEKGNNAEYARVFDNIERYKRALAVIGEVERFNDKVLKIKEIMG